MILKNLKQYLFFILERIVYFTYKIDITLLSVFSRGPQYFVFIFAFFFGSFGSPKGLSLEIAAFKYFCFLFAWYLIITSFFIFLSFQISSLKEYLYGLLGKTWVTDRIGNPGTQQFMKLGTVGLATIGVNELSKWADASQNQSAGAQIMDNHVSTAQTEGRAVDVNSRSYRDASRAATEVISRQPRGFLDRCEERAATDLLVRNVRGGLSDWWNRRN